MRQYFTESSESLQSCAESYACKQNAMLINKTFHQILFILLMSDIGFVPFPDFRAPIQNFDFGLFDLKSKFEIAQILYRSYFK